jgi:GrpB-like predicted nucleotidyltransferase (UPF0157 family)
MNDTSLKRTVTVMPYDPKWPKQFESERLRLIPVFGDELIALYHVGSTSVPGLAAKPTLDLMAEVRSIEAITHTRSAFESLGYIARGAFGIEGREFFVMGAPNPTHHLHVFETGDPNLDRHLAFRDYLRTHPEAAAHYANLKTELAKTFRHDPAGYQEGKSQWIHETEALALSWYCLQRQDGP